jgi:hypothetical protein
MLRQSVLSGIALVAVGIASPVRAEFSVRRFSNSERAAALGQTHLAAAFTMWSARVSGASEGIVEATLRNLVSEARGVHPDDGGDDFELARFRQMTTDGLGSFLLEEGVEGDREPTGEEVDQVVAYLDAFGGGQRALYFARWYDQQMGGSGDGAIVVATKPGSDEVVVLDIFVYAE